MSTTSDSRFRPFKVARKVRESANITSFYLEPVDPAHWRSFEPGQFLTLQVPQPSGGVPIIRNYTVSSSPADDKYYRITVKREASLDPALPHGICSLWLHDSVGEGALVHVDGPRGAFKLNLSSERPVILLSGGVGLTPVVSMLKVLAEVTDRKVWFIHACDNGDVHALRQEIDQLAASRDGIKVHYCYRFPSEEDIARQSFHSTGFVSRQTLQQLQPFDDYEIYMCGPPPFMQAMYNLLTDLGIDRTRIVYEFFGPASLLSMTTTINSEPVKVVVESSPSPAPKDALTIEVRSSGKRLIWDDTADSLLSFLESHGENPPFSCRAGVCASCLQDLVSGDVDYVEDPLDEVPSGKVLLCCCKPATSIVLNLSNT